MTQFRTPPPDPSFCTPLGEALARLFSGDQLAERLDKVEFIFAGNGLTDQAWVDTVREQAATEVARQAAAS